MKSRLFCFLALCAIGLSACNSSKTPVEKPYIAPPIPALDPSFTVFDIDPSKDNDLKLPSGTSIHIPANCLSDDKGNTVAGKVQLKYREFQDASGIYLSGIPMRYDTAGKAENLTTAGMFEIRATQNGQSLKPKQAGCCSIRLASQTAGDDYNTYYLDEKGKNWKYLGVNKAEINQEKVALKRKIDSQMPKIPFPLDSRYFAMNFMSLVDAFYNNDYNAIRNADKELVKKKMLEYGLSWQDIYSYDPVTIGKTQYPAIMIVWKKITKQKFPTWAQYASVKQVKGSEYEMKVFDAKGEDSLAFRVEAVMTVSELMKFPPAYWEKNYKAAIERLSVERERMALMAEVYRQVEIDGFGIYNYDKLMKEENRVEVLASFDFKVNIDKAVTDIDEVVFIPSDNRSIVKLTKDHWENLPLVPDEGGRIFALLPGNKLAIYPVQKYAAIDFDGLRKQSKPSFKFDMGTVSEPVNSEKDFKRILGI